MRVSNVTLGSIAMNELDCPRLVFITPYTPPEQRRSIKTRVSNKLTKTVCIESSLHRVPCPLPTIDGALF